MHLAPDRRPDLLQFSGFLHGGVITRLADTAAGAAATTSMPPGQIGVTVDLHVNFLSPADGESIVAKAEALRTGKTISVAKVEVTTIHGDEERLCALCAVTLRAVERPPPG